MGVHRAGDVVGGRYEVERELARGAMGVVYVARHTLSRKQVALKVLDAAMSHSAEALHRFRREVSVRAETGHEGIVDVLDAGIDERDGAPFLAMELLSGETLGRRLARPAPLAERVAWIERALEPLSAAHAKGFVHRDLKPDNVFVARQPDGSERVKILDFGLSRHLESTGMTLTSSSIGTPVYMSPEGATNAKAVTAAADVWAIGVMLYEIATGSPPFEGPTPHAVAVAVMLQPHRPLSSYPNVDARLGAFVDRCLSKDPGHRPADAGRALAELREILPSLRAPAAPVSGFGATEALDSHVAAISAPALSARIESGAAAGPRPLVLVPLAPAERSPRRAWVIGLGAVVVLLLLASCIGAAVAAGVLAARSAGSAIVERSPPELPPAASSSSSPAVAPVAAASTPSPTVPAPVPSAPSPTLQDVLLAGDAPRHHLAVPDDAPSLGPRDAPVTVQILSEFENPFSASLSRTLRTLQQPYEGRVRWVWRHLTLSYHRNSIAAAELALEARAQHGDDGFWRAHDLLFERRSALGRAELRGYAMQLGLDLRRYDTAIATGAHQRRVEQDVGAIHALEARPGVPSILVADRLMSGAQPYAAIRAAIDAALAEAAR